MEFDKNNIDVALDHVFNAQGFIKDVGIKLIDVNKGYAKGRIYIEEKHANPMGAVHGGALFALADTIGGTAALTYGSKVVTLNSNINYLNPAANTEYIEAEANVIRDGKTTAVYDVMIRSKEGVDVAKVTLTYYKVGWFIVWIKIVISYEK